MQNSKDYTPESIISILREQDPTYAFRRNLGDSNELAEIFENDEYVLPEHSLHFHGYHSHIKFEKNATKQVENLIFDYKKKKSMSILNKEYFQTVLDEIVLAESSYEKINVRGKEFYFQKDSKIFISEGSGDYTYYTIETIEENYFEEILEVSTTKYRLIQKLKEALEGLVSSSDETEQKHKNHNKLELKLSVPDIALLFRLLDEEKIINYKYKTEIYRFISNTLKTEKQDEISQDSIKNIFYSPVGSSIEKLDILLVNLRQRLKKIEE